MKKLIVASAAAIMMTVSVITAQTTYACFCIQGIIWEKGCPELPATPAKPTTPTTPSKPTEPTTPAVTPTPPITPAAETPKTPTVVTASTTKTTVTPAAATTPVELPETGIDSTIATIAGIGIASYLAAYAYTRIAKR